MSWWNDSDGNSIADGKKDYTSAGGDFDVIPKGTKVLAMVDDAGWKAVYQRSEEFINVKWRVMKPSQYEGRVIFQKLFVDDANPQTPPDKIAAKRDAAKRQLSVIDANHKSKLTKLTARPTDQQLALALVAAQCVLSLEVWDKTDPADDTKKVPGGNWVRGINPKGGEITADVAKRAAPAPMTDPFDSDLDGDVPF